MIVLQRGPLLLLIGLMGVKETKKFYQYKNNDEDIKYLCECKCC